MLCDMVALVVVCARVDYGFEDMSPFARNVDEVVEDMEGYRCGKVEYRNERRIVERSAYILSRMYEPTRDDSSIDVHPAEVTLMRPLGLSRNPKCTCE